MKIGGNFSEPGNLVPAMWAWRVEKPSASNNLREETRRTPARAVAIVKTDAVSSTSRCGIRPIDEEQPLLPATFVAQVLGQIMAAASDNRLVAARAYERRDSGNTNSRFARIA